MPPKKKIEPIRWVNLELPESVLEKSRRFAREEKMSYRAWCTREFAKMIEEM